MMKKVNPSKKIYIAASRIHKAGRGVFAGENIRGGGIIEVCPVIVVSQKERFLLRKTSLVNYYFLWGKQKRKNLRTAAICLGYGSLYNHSFRPNAQYKKDVAASVILFSALRDIKKDEEITINYNGNPKDLKDIWIKGIPTAKVELNN